MELEKGKMIDWMSMAKVNIIKMEINEKGNYRMEIKQQPGKYYVSKPNEMLDTMYKDYQAGRQVEITFETNPGGPAFRRIG